MSERRITPDEVRHIARLARLALSEAEVDLFTTQLGDILTYAAAIDRIDTTGTVATAHASLHAPAWRDDVAVPSLTREDAQANAPDAAAGFFRVPNVRP